MLRLRGDRDQHEWIDPDFYTCKLIKHGRQETQIAPSSALFPLFRLPAELILLVAEHLGVADFLPFRVSNKFRVYEVIDRPTPKVLGGSKFDVSQGIGASHELTMEAVDKANMFRRAQDDLAMRFHRDRYTRITEVESSTPSEKLPSSYCLDLHHASAFSVAEAAGDSHERKCKGSLRTYRVCSHVSLSHAQFLKLYHQTDKGVEYGRALCPLGPVCKYMSTRPIVANSLRGPCLHINFDLHIPLDRVPLGYWTQPRG